MKIYIDGKPLELPEAASIDIEDSSPIFNERGSQSLPMTLPASPANSRVLGFPERLDTGADPNNPARVATVQAGALIRRGVLNIVSAGTEAGISVNIGFDNSAAYQVWSSKKLTELSSLRVLEGHDVGMEDGVEGITDYLRRLSEQPNPERDSYAVFPLAIARETVTLDDSEQTLWEVLNVPDANGSLRQPGKLKRVIEGVPTDVSVPEGYGLSPFIRVWRVLELVFEDLGVIYDGNFARDPEFNRLVLLNNAADAICTGVIREADLLPDCTVAEFMNALWVRFGLVYNINYTSRRVSLCFLRDILKEKPNLDVGLFCAGEPTITYNSPQYVTLSAKTSLEGAAPPAERFEDFSKGLDLRGLHLGADVSAWTFVPSSGGAGGKWDGDVREDFWNAEPENPEPPEPEGPETPEPDEPEPGGWDDRDDMYSRCRAAAETAAAPTSFLAHEYVTGNWYVIDENNHAIKSSGSGFFSWNPASKGLTAFELSSDDECIPVVRVSTIGTGSAYDFNDYAPAFLVGARHYHSYIVGVDDDTSQVATPLAFALAYPLGGKTVGRVSPEGPDGQRLKLDDGSTPSLSLFFQFEDGLFATFWKDFDEILRHGNRSIELPVLLDAATLEMDSLSPVTFRGVRGLLDALEYSLPSGERVPATMHFRTISTQGDYDISAEQNIPHFSAAAGGLTWQLLTDGFPELDANSAYIRAQAARQYKDETGYVQTGTTGDIYDVTASSVVLKELTRITPTWQNDTTLPAPYEPGAKLIRYYKALASYDVYEEHETTLQGEPSSGELSREPIGSVSLRLTYSVTIIARRG